MSRKLTSQERWQKIQPLINRTFLCWHWEGTKNPDGYAKYGKVSVHRLAFEIFKGTIPNNCEIDHLCRNRGCVNPDHLEAVSHKINVLRGNGIAAQLARMSHCPNGHRLSGNNLIVRKSGKRLCKSCYKSYKQRSDVRERDNTQRRQRRSWIAAKRKEIEGE